MKKRMAGVLAVTVIAAALAGCGKENPILGTWKAETVRMSGVEIDLSEWGSFAESMGQDQLENIFFVFGGNGRVEGTASGSVMEGTWTQEGEAYTMQLDGQSVEMRLEDGQLILEENEAEIVCERQ